MQEALPDKQQIRKLAAKWRSIKNSSESAAANIYHRYAAPQKIVRRGRFFFLGRSDLRGKHAATSNLPLSISQRHATGHAPICRCFFYWCGLQWASLDGGGEAGREGGSKRRGNTKAFAIWQTSFVFFFVLSPRKRENF